MLGPKQDITAVFAIPATPGAYAPERPTFGLRPASGLVVATGIGTLTAAIEVSTAAGAVLELWLPKLNAKPTVDEVPDDADYFYAGRAITGGVLSASLGAYPGAQLRAKSGGAAGALTVHAVTTDAPADADRGSREVAVGSIAGNDQAVTLQWRAPFNGGLAIQTTGTFSGTLNIEGSVDGTTFVALRAENIATGVIATSATAASVKKVDIVGLTAVRARGSGWVSGTAVVTIAAAAG